MRYVVIAKKISLNEAEKLCRSAGATNITVMPITKQLYCDMSEEQAARLSGYDGIVVRQVSQYSAEITVPTISPIQEVTYVGSFDLSPVFRQLQMVVTPPLDGFGATVAVLDTGIRKTHNSLKDKIVYEYNATEASSTDDVFGHGTGVAYLIAGEDGERCGISPGASIMNIKVLDDQGNGTDETVVAGIEQVINLVGYARLNGKPQTDAMYPNIINLSLGKPDEGDPDDPVRVACRVAVNEYGLAVIAAAGNSGPAVSTIYSPACDQSVLAVGAVFTDQFSIWPNSSRGPTLEALTKPDIVCWGVGLEVAGNTSDDIYVNKSGTSFATPIMSGFNAIMWDVFRRLTNTQLMVRLKDIVEFMPAICSKPPDAPTGKDNTYGYGFPVLSSFVQQFTTRQEPISQLLQLLPMFFIIGMVPEMYEGG
jgi:serine protease AprX